MLQLHQVSKRFRKTGFVLNNVSFGLDKGLHMLIGPNGAGKSTLLRIISTITRPDTGDILFNDRNIYSDLPEYKFNLGYLPQDLGFYNHMTGREFLCYIASLKGIIHQCVPERVDYVSKLLGIQQQCNRKICTLSAGQKQRLGLAQALLNNPAILVLDEPFCGLDPEEADQVGRLLGRLSHDKLVLISSHIMEKSLISRLLLLVNGKLQFVGSTSEFLDAVKGQVWLAETTKDEWFKIQQKYLTSTAIFKADRCQCKIISQNKPAISEIKVIDPDLEDAYIFWLQQCTRENEDGIQC